LDGRGLDSSEQQKNCVCKWDVPDMTITLVQSTGVSIDNATSGTKAFASNVTAGNRIVVAAFFYSPSADLPVAGDCTQSAGTATLSAFTLDVTPADNDGGGGVHYYAAVWSALVTGSGSCTIQVGGRPAASYFNFGIAEFNSDRGQIVFSGLASSDTGETGAADSGNMTTPGAAVFVGSMEYSSTGAITITPDGAFTQIFEEEDGNLHSTGSSIYRIVSAQTTDSVSWSAPTNNQWAASGAVYQEQLSIAFDDRRTRFQPLIVR
jgi:hypothetical protein